MRRLFLTTLIFFMMATASFAQVSANTAIPNLDADAVGAKGDLIITADVNDSNRTKKMTIETLMTVEPAATATALAANGADCSAGSYPLGVDASGASASCTDATTEINSVVNGLGGTNLTCSGQNCDVDDAFLVNNANDSTTGVLTSIGFTIGSAAIIEAELETIDGVTAGTAAASKALVLDASSDIATINSLTATTLIGALTGAATGNLLNSESDTLIGTLTADGLTLGANENITLGGQTLDHDGTDFAFNDSVTSSGLVTASGVLVTTSIQMNNAALYNCDTLDTDAGGTIVCGTDGGAAGGDAWSDAVDSDILPTGADNTYDLGSVAASFADIFWDGTATGDVTGALTGNADTVTTITGLAPDTATTQAAQPNITSVGTLTTLTVDDITVNGNTISSGGASTLAITPTVGQSITLDGTIQVDAGVVTGATSITSTSFVGALTGEADTVTTVSAGDYAAASIDGDDINSNIAGRSLTLTGASPDTLDADAELYTGQAGRIAFEDPIATDDFFFGEINVNQTAVAIYCKTLVGTVDLDVTIGGTAVNGSAITCNTTGVLDASLAGDTDLDIGEELKLDITSVASSPTYLMVIVNATKDD